MGLRATVRFAKRRPRVCRDQGGECEAVGFFGRGGGAPCVNKRRSRAGRRSGRESVRQVQNLPSNWRERQERSGARSQRSGRSARGYVSRLPLLRREQEFRHRLGLGYAEGIPQGSEGKNPWHQDGLSRSEV